MSHRDRISDATMTSYGYSNKTLLRHAPLLTRRFLPWSRWRLGTAVTSQARSVLDTVVHAVAVTATHLGFAVQAKLIARRLERIIRHRYSVGGERARATYERNDGA